MATAHKVNFAATDEAAEARSAVRPGHSLPGYYYTSHEQYAQDMVVLREKLWLLAGHESQIPNTGDYKLFEVDGESIILVRDKSGAVNAFYNVCRHRGSLICTEQQGNARLLVCPYHAWSYRLDGSLLPPRSMPESFDPKQYSLKPCHVETLDGILFVSLATGTPPDFEEFAAPLRKYLAPFALKRTRAVIEEHMGSDANWKISQENMLECYHCPVAHKNLIRVTLGGMGPEEYVHPNGETYSQRLNRLNRNIPEMSGGPETPYMQAGMVVPMGDGHISPTMNGEKGSKLLGDMEEYSGSWTLMNFNPQAHAVLYDDIAQLLAYTPLSATRTNSTMIWLLHEDAVEGEDYEMDQIVPLLRLTMQEDIRITDEMQRGVSSKSYEPGPHSYEESRVGEFDEWYIRHIVDAA